MKTILKIEEMSCKPCVQHVHEAIVQNSNVSAVDVSYPAKVIASF